MQQRRPSPSSLLASLRPTPAGGSGTYAPQGGETWATFRTRTATAVAQAAREGARHLLVVCHGGVIRALHEHFLALKPSRIIPVGPPSLTSRRLDTEGAARLELFNFTPGHPEFAAPD